jgi:hypothetical protein
MKSRPHSASVPRLHIATLHSWTMRKILRNVYRGVRCWQNVYNFLINTTEQHNRVAYFTKVLSPEAGYRKLLVSGLGIFHFSTASRTALGPTQPPIQLVPGALSLRIKRVEREADHSHLVPRSRMHGDITPLPQYALMEGCLVKHGDNSTSATVFSG